MVSVFFILPKCYIFIVENLEATEKSQEEGGGKVSPSKVIANILVNIFPNLALKIKGVLE